MTALQLAALVAVVAMVYLITYALGKAWEAWLLSQEPPPESERDEAWRKQFVGFTVEEHKRGQVIDAPTLIQRLKASKEGK